MYVFKQAESIAPSAHVGASPGINDGDPDQVHIQILSWPSTPDLAMASSAVP